MSDACTLYAFSVLCDYVGVVGVVAFEVIE